MAARRGQAAVREAEAGHPRALRGDNGFTVGGEARGVAARRGQAALVKAEAGRTRLGGRRLPVAGWRSL